MLCSYNLIAVVLRAVKGSRPAGALPEGDATSPSAHHDHDEDGPFASGKKQTRGRNDMKWRSERSLQKFCVTDDDSPDKQTFVSLLPLRSDGGRIHHPCRPPGLRLPDRQPPAVRHLGWEDGVQAWPLPRREPRRRGEVCLRTFRSR